MSDAQVMVSPGCDDGHPRCAVIIPAHNEARVIGRTLAALLGGPQAKDLFVVVVANGCRDNTADVARATIAEFGTPNQPRAQVIQTKVASKVHAINLGEQALARGVRADLPRVVLDADVEVSTATIIQLVSALQAPGVLASMPVPRFDLAGSTWGVRAYYRIWTALPYFGGGMIGSGVYVLSPEGRRKFGAFPPVIADDLFAKLHFKPRERVVLRDCHTVVRAPGTLWNLIKIKTRSHLGNVELRLKYPSLFANDEAAVGSGVARLARNPFNWPALALYVLVKVVVRCRAWAQVRQGRFSHWERDESSRRGTHPTTAPGAQT